MKYTDITDTETFKILQARTSPHFVDFLCFFVDEDNYIKQLTFNWYLKGKCKTPQLVEENRFTKSSAKWDSSENLQFLTIVNLLF